jgi:Zn-dependent membrane protease YugP
METKNQQAVNTDTSNTATASGEPATAAASTLNGTGSKIDIGKMLYSISQMVAGAIIFLASLCFAVYMIREHFSAKRRAAKEKQQQATSSKEKKKHKKKYPKNE